MSVRNYEPHDPDHQPSLTSSVRLRPCLHPASPLFRSPRRKSPEVRTAGGDGDDRRQVFLPGLPGTPRAHLDGQNQGMPGSGIAHRAQQGCFRKSYRPKFIQEDDRLLRAGDSREPVGFALLSIGRQRLSQNNLRGIDGAVIAHHAADLAKDLAALRV